MKYLALYLAAVTLITVILTVYDKIAAKKDPKHRVPEKTLILFGILGGALGEYIVMQLIRHKTKHKKFMIGLPVILAVQAIALAALYIYKIF